MHRVNGPFISAQRKLLPSAIKGVHSTFYPFTQLAANSGMRAGFHYTKDNTLAAEITLGVVGSSRPNTWFTKLVPVEVVGHYNVVPLLLDDSPLKFNVDLGFGSALVRAKSASYNPEVALLLASI